jgi:hypothetical protein
LIKKLLHYLITAGFLLLSIPENAVAQKTKVEICTWKECQKGAISVSLDDSEIPCLKSLNRNHFKATYYISPMAMNESENKKRGRYFYFKNLYKDKNEMGGHTYSHTCSQLSQKDMRIEFVKNIFFIEKVIKAASTDIVTMSWPCGFVQNKELAAEYFLAARGYQINKLEDTTPEDFMNLKSFNSPEHNTPDNNPSLINVVMQAEKTGKWAIFVFHYSCDDYHAIDLAAKKNLWVAPVKDVVLYILERNGTQIKDYVETSTEINFNATRKPLRTTSIRNFETTLKPSDQITLKVDIDDTRNIKGVLVNEKKTQYRITTLDSNKYLLVNTFIPSQVETKIKVVYE